MGIKSKIKKKIYSYYFKKGMLNAAKEITNKAKIHQANIQQTLSNINKTILDIKEEADLFLKALAYVESKYEKHSKAAEVSTIFPFLSLSILDILILNKQFLSTNDSIEKNFICRTAAQHMYEFLEDASRALGKTMNYFIGPLNDQNINSKLKELRESFNKLKNELHEPLKELRNNASAHKDRDISNQLSISAKIDIADFQKNFVLFLFFFIELTMLKRAIFDKMLNHHNVSNNVNTSNK